MKKSIGYILVAVAAAVASFLIAKLAFNIQDRKQEAKTPFVRVAEVNELTTDPKPWGENWPHQFDGYMATAGDKFHGGSSALPDSKLEKFPWLKRLYDGYAFALDYREARGHAYMLYDQGVTRRVTERQQSGACLHCHASIVPTYRKVGLESMGLDASDEALGAEFNWDAVNKGFEETSTQKYEDVFALMLATSDGTPDTNETAFPMPPPGGFDGVEVPDDHVAVGHAHPVSCIDCHDPNSLGIRITRPGFVQGIAALAKSDEPVKHLPSIEKWRRGDRERDYDPNLDASRQEMRSFVCAQCHVEYYCANKLTLRYPWGNGLKAEQLEQFWDETEFEDGSQFFDYIHPKTGAKLLKAQHPEFELWSQGVHAQSGVSCADCHMPYERKGAQKVSSHAVTSPMEMLNNACQTCHKVPEDDLRYRVETIQERTMELMDVAANAMTDMLDAVIAAKEAGATDEQLKEIHALQRKSMWRLDYISSENSKGFHAAQEAARVLGESIDYSRQAQVKAIALAAELAKE